MKKTIFAIIATIAFITFIKDEKIHAQTGRAPSVEPVVEVDIEDAKKHGSDEAGFNFNHAVATRAPAVVKRKPANITPSKNQTSSYFGPMLFLLTLPFAIWMVISRKLKSQPAPEKSVGYYPKTQQFKPFRSDSPHTPDDEDDIDFPRAS